jgi:subtilisin-like proprotein convertase family protein
VPEGLEGPYQLYLRVTDESGKVSGGESFLWEGEIDTQAPRVTLEAWEAIPGRGALYTCAVEDYNLSLTQIDCPVPLVAITYQDAPWFTDIYSTALKPASAASGGVWLPESGDVYTAGACDLYANCATTTATVVPPETSASPAVRIAQPLPDAPFTDPDASLVISGTAYAVAGLESLDVRVNGAGVHAQSWTTPTTEATWTTDWTPGAVGTYTITAVLTDSNSIATTNTASGGDPVQETRVHVAAEAPQVVVDTSKLDASHVLPSGGVWVSGTFSDSVGMKYVDARVGGEWQRMHVDGDFWWGVVDYDVLAALDDSATAAQTRGLAALVANPTVALEVRATNLGGITQTTTANLPLDTLPPAPFEASLGYLDGGTTVPVSDGETISAVTNPTLTLSWEASSDPSGLTEYEVTWTLLEKDGSETILKREMTGGLMSQYAASEGEHVQARVVVSDTAGNVQSVLPGAVYLDDPTTPAYVDMAGVRRGGIPYRNWLDEACNLLGVDYRYSALATELDVADQPQAFYAAWDDAGLRMSWSGADWEHAGDLFVYLDTDPHGANGTNHAHNPYANDIILRLPIEETAGGTDAMLADTFIWVQDRETALLGTWNGSSWDLTPLTGYAFSEGITDLYLPFTELDIYKPAERNLQMVAFATEEGGLRLWATAPAYNSLNSRRLVPAADGQTAQLFALTHRYHWFRLGSGICPSEHAGTNPQYNGADLRADLTAATGALAYGLHADGLFFTMPDLLPDLANWSSDRMTLCAANPDAPLCRRDLIDNPRPTGMDFDSRSHLAGLMDTEVVPLPDDATVDFVLSVHNRGRRTSTEGMAEIVVDGPLQLAAPVGGTIELPNIAPGERITVAFQVQVDRALDFDAAWGNVDVVIYDAMTSARNPLERFYADVAIDRGEEEIAFAPELQLINPYTNTLYGTISGPEPMPTVTVETNADDTLFTCANEIAAAGGWRCDLDFTGLNLVDGQTLDVRAYATDAHGGQTDESPWVSLTVDATPPTVTLGTRASLYFTDTLINATETALAGLVGDDHLAAGVELCQIDSAEEACGTADLPGAAAPTAVHAYGDSPTQTLDIPTCTDGWLVREFDVAEDLSIADLNVGLAVEHAFRNDVVAELVSPDNATVEIVHGGSWAANYALLLDDAAIFSLSEDFSDHPANGAFDRRRRPANPLSAFNGEFSSGTWTLRLCDQVGAADAGTYLGSELAFTLLSDRIGATDPADVSWQYELPVDEGVERFDQVLEITPIDAAGNRGAPLQLDYTLDTLAPRVEFVLPVIGTVTDTVGVASMTAKFHQASSTFEESIAIQGTRWEFTATKKLSDEAIYALYVQAEDLAGNVTELPVRELMGMGKGIRQLHMPLISQNYTPAPDLVVDNVEVTTNTISITISNQGPLPAEGGFWVDLYFAPSPPPTQANETWSDGRSTYGAVWGFESDLMAGETVTLMVNDGYFSSDHSSLPTSYTAHDPIYVQVDSYDPGSTHGAILEVDEITGQLYNNIFVLSDSDGPATQHRRSR